PKHRTSASESDSGAETLDSSSSEAATSDDESAGHSPPMRFLQGMIFRINDIGCLCVPGFWKSTVDPWQLPHASMLLFVGLMVVLGIGWWEIVPCRLRLSAR